MISSRNAGAVIYVHGKGGSAAESSHYEPLFPLYEVIGIEYGGDTPWEAGAQIRAAVRDIGEQYGETVLIANSIGAFFSMNAGIDTLVSRAYFISPIADMEKLICGMTAAAGITEDQLRKRGTIRTVSGDVLSWEYLCFVREHPVEWRAPTEIIYGENDMLTDGETAAAFAERIGAGFNVMPGGEHWFHTEEQMKFLDEVIIRAEEKHGAGKAYGVL